MPVDQQVTQQLLEAAVGQAQVLGVKVCIAVVDASGLLTGFTRMDGAFPGSVEVAIGKAKTSVLFPLPTGKFGELVRNEQLTGMELSNGGLVCFAGGLPIKLGEACIGAIGVSGATAEQDAQVAEQALLAVNP